MTKHTTSEGIPIAPGCELTPITCGDDCACEMGHFCLTHQQDDGSEWPCDEQKAYEETPEVQIIVLGGMLRRTTKLLHELAENHEKLARDHTRLTRIVEDAVFPFMRDALPHIGGELQISWGIGDSEPLLGCDIAEGVTTYNRGRKPGTLHGITYTAGNGTVWQNGTRVPKPLFVGGEDGGGEGK